MLPLNLFDCLKIEKSEGGMLGIQGQCSTIVPTMEETHTAPPGLFIYEYCKQLQRIILSYHSSCSCHATGNRKSVLFLLISS